MPEETAIDAMNAALGEAIAPKTVEEAEPDPELETEVEPEGEEAEGEPEGEEAEGEEAESERGPNGERERNPDGTWKKTEPEKPAKKEPDPINDPIPKDLKQTTQERMRSLIETVKTTTAEREKLQQDFDYLVQGVQATGASPQQYGETLSWLALFNSPDPKNQEKALELVESVAERLSMLLGKERSVGDPMKAHPDLVEAVRTGKVTPEYAREIARTRNAQQFRGQIEQTTRTEAQQQQQAQQELATARADLTALEDTLRGTDPQYNAKKAVLVPALQPVFAMIPPSQWKAKFQEAYRNVQIDAAPARSAPSQVPKNQPMRAGKQPAGGQAKAPANMLEAINGALAGMPK